MNNKEKARELSKKFARQYHANNWPEWSDDEAFHYSYEEINNACLEMAQWKDEQVKQIIQTMIDDCDSTNPYHVYRHDALNDLYEKLFVE